MSGFLLFPLSGFLVPVIPLFVVNKEKQHLIPSPDEEEMILFALNSSRPVF